MRIQTRKYDYLTEGLYSDSDIFFLKFSANHSSLIEYCLKDEYIKEKEPKQIYDLLNSTLNNDFYHWKDEYAFIEKNKSNDVDYCLFAIDHDNFIKVCIILLNDAHSPIVLYWIDKKEDAPSLEEAIELCQFGYHKDYDKLIELKLKLEKYVKILFFTQIQAMNGVLLLLGLLITILLNMIMVGTMQENLPNQI